MRCDNGMEISRRSLLTASALAPLARAAAKSALLYIGVYTDEKTKGIHVARFDESTGAISDLTLAAETPNPTFLELHPSGKYLYAVNEVNSFAGQKTGSVGAYAIDRASGKLSLLNMVSSKGPGPCHVSLDKTGRTVMATNYGGGSLASYQVLADGKLSEAVSFFQHEGKGPNARRQERAHAHSINRTPDNKFAVVCDLGMDQIVIYKLDAAKGSLEKYAETNMAPGSGPRHFAWHPNGVNGYSINELASTVTLFMYNAGGLDEIQTISTLPEDFKGQNTTAEIRIHPSGKWLYGSNRGHDSIAVFNLDKETAKLAPAEYVSTQGVMPRNFYIDPTGHWLLAANQKSNSIVVFAIDQKTGKLRPANQTASLGAPVCLRILRA